jgi:hypothetical protein
VKLRSPSIAMLCILAGGVHVMLTAQTHPERPLSIGVALSGSGALGLQTEPESNWPPSPLDQNPLAGTPRRNFSLRALISLRSVQ